MGRIHTFEFCVSPYQRIGNILRYRWGGRGVGDEADRGERVRSHIDEVSWLGPGEQKPPRREAAGGTSLPVSYNTLCTKHIHLAVRI